MSSSDAREGGRASAAEILGNVAAVYAGAATYADAGEVRTTFFGTDGPRTTVRRFATALDRLTGRFRFEFRERCWDDGPEQRYVVWRGRATVQTWWDVRPGVREEGSLGLALAGATGVSGGSAHTVPALLMPDEVGGRSLAELVGSAERLADATIDGISCYCIAGVIPMPDGEGGRISVFVDQRTLLVRQIVDRGRLREAGVEVESLTTYDAGIDVVVPDDAFEFAMPPGCDA
ncbi:MAG TPA: hypothetical protein VF624_08735 [Tepidisphaeraceae bacterium]|jgi:hypothetical protein